MSVRFLMVDDEEIVIRSCRRILAAADLGAAGADGIAVDAARSRPEALRLVERQRYDVVALDIMMPEVAHAGTLFLDEFGNIPLSIQAKRLRVIQERRCRAPTCA